MSTTVVFDLLSDDEAMQSVIADIKADPVLTWRVAVFCCQMQLDKAIKAQAVREHYDSIHMRARATRAARMAGDEEQKGEDSDNNSVGSSEP